MSFLSAWQLLTSIPLPWHREARMEPPRSATVYFPVVGLIIGLILAGLSWILSFFLPLAVVNALLMVALVVITGALHLDGFADTCDGIAGHKPVEERWRVMRDSHTGAFGVVGIVLLLLVKYVSLNSIPPALITATLLFMPVVSRWAIVYAIFAYPYARPAGLGMAFKQKTRWPQFTAATLITLAVAGALFPFFSMMGFLLVVGVWIVTVAFAAYLKRKFAGLTGDTYGAINEIAEVIVLVFSSLAYTVAVNLR
ncbi:MAG: cobalamin 5'-phosphate synthase [Chloroflexi bacterium RBG_16_50_9]|nr:MAG: cobalamin 5'-phosphate synthase [Chloroflexi bacterium RBG_16_50_9]